MEDAETPPLERTYGYPRGARWTYVAAAVAAGAMAVGAVALQLTRGISLYDRGQLLVFTAVFSAVAYHGAAAARILSGGVRLARTGVAPVGGALVPWSDVVRVEIQPLLQTMHVFGSDGRRLLSLRPELESFAAVQSYIIDHMEPRVCPLPCAIRLLSPAAGAPIAVLAALLAVWLGPRRGLLPPLLFLGIALLVALLYLARRRSLAVTAEGVVLRQGWQRLAVPFREVTAVHVQARPRTGGGAVHFVVLERNGAPSIPVAGFRHGYHEAFRCIEAAWRAALAPR